MRVSLPTHHTWVYPLDPGIQDISRDNAPQHTKPCLPLVGCVSLRNCASAGLIWRLRRGVSAVRKRLRRRACAAYAPVMMLPLLCARLSS
jgi:hypothetical protein